MTLKRRSTSASASAKEPSSSKAAGQAQVPRGNLPTKDRGAEAIRRTATTTGAQQGRELLRAEEILGLSQRIALILTPGIPPLWTTLVRYYESSFKTGHSKFWPAVNAFVQALALFLAIGFLAVAMTGWTTGQNWQDMVNQLNQGR